MTGEINFIVEPTALQTISALEIKANWDETKKQLTELVKPYKNLIVSEEAIGAAKQDRAKLRKLETNIDSYRKTIKQQYTEPLAKFEDKCKQLVSTIHEATNNLDTQVKDYETRQKQKKLEQIESYYEACVKEHPGCQAYYKYDVVYNPKWVNATYSIDTAKKDIDEYIAGQNEGLAFIKGLDSEFEIVLLKAFREGKGLPDIIRLENELKRNKEIEEELERRRSEAEAEKAKAENVAEQKPKMDYRQNVIPKEEAVPAEPEEEILEPIHTVKIWVQGTRRQLASLSGLLRQAGVSYGAISD